MMKVDGFALIMAWMDRSTELLTVVLAVWMLTLIGCQSETLYVPDKAQQAAIVAELKMAGPWSPPAGTLRCRLLLQSNQIMETSTLGGAILIENTTGRSITLHAAGSPPFGAQSVRWRADDHWLRTSLDIVPVAQLTTETTSLAPGDQLVLESHLLVAPGPGQRQISAALVTTDGQTLLTPPITVQVTPADWGQPNDGIRLRLSSRKLRYVVGENLMLNAFIHNMEHDPLSMHPPDWSSLQIDVRRDLVLMRVSTADAQNAQVARGQAWWSTVPTSLLLAPGKYTLRLEFNSPELPVSYARAWHGRVASNEATIEVVAR